MSDKVTLFFDFRSFIDDMEDEELFAELHEGLNWILQSHSEEQIYGQALLQRLFMHIEGRVHELYHNNEFAVVVEGETLYRQEVKEKYGASFTASYGDIEADVLLEKRLLDMVVHVIRTSEMVKKERLVADVRSVTKVSEYDEETGYMKLHTLC